MDYVILDFRGQSDGRPTRCSATRSCLVNIIIDHDYHLRQSPNCFAAFISDIIYTCKIKELFHFAALCDFWNNILLTKFARIFKDSASSLQQSSLDPTVENVCLYSFILE